jgi:hypothetical protein
VTILDHVGANLAPWNLEGLNIRRTENGVVVEGKPLVFFHFHGLRLSADVRGSLAADRGPPGLRQSLRRVRQALRVVASGNALLL